MRTLRAYSFAVTIRSYGRTFMTAVSLSLASVATAHTLPHALPQPADY
jgi:hypothetical protein